MAGPARTATPIPLRIGRTQSRTYQEMLAGTRMDGEEGRLRGLIAKAFDGKLNCTNTVALEVDPATTTDIDDPRIGPNTIAFLVGIDADGAAEITGISQTVVEPGKIRLTHTASALTRTLGYALLG